MKKRNFVKCLIVLAVVIIFAGSFTAVGYAKEKPKTITLKALCAWPPTNATSKVYFIWENMLRDAVAKKYPGELVLDNIGGPEITPTREQIEAVRRGVVDVCYYAGGYYTGLLPTARCYMLSEITPIEERENGAYDLLNKLHQEVLNVYNLGHVVTGKFQLWGNKKVTKPDFTGLRIRSAPGYDPFTKALNGAPIQIPQVDVYSAIQKNMIDAYFSAFIGIRTWGWDEVTKYAIGPPFYTLPNVLLVNLDVWNKIPKHLQELLIEVTKQHERDEVARKDAQTKEEVAKLEKVGIEFIKWSPEDKRSYLKIIYDTGWKAVNDKDPVNGPKLEKLMRKSW